MIENDSNPRPSDPAISHESVDVAAIHAGGCGSWNGLGVTTRSGNWNVGESQLKRSLLPRLDDDVDRFFPLVVLT